MKSFRERMAAANAEAKEGFAKIRSDIRQESAQIKAEAKARFGKVRSELRQDMEQANAETRAALDQLRLDKAKHKAAADQHRAEADRRKLEATERKAEAHRRKTAAQNQRQAEADQRKATEAAQKTDAPAETIRRRKRDLAAATEPPARKQRKIGPIKANRHQPSDQEPGQPVEPETGSSSKTPTLSGRGPGRVARMPIVRVSYCPFGHEPTDLQGYAYRWPLKKTPQIGDRVFVTSGDSQALEPAVVVGFGRGTYTGHLKWVRRLATPADIRRDRWYGW